MDSKQNILKGLYCMYFIPPQKYIDQSGFFYINLCDPTLLIIGIMHKMSY